MTWSTCLPQPAHVVFPHVLHLTAWHIADLLSSLSDTQEGIRPLPAGTVAGSRCPLQVERAQVVVTASRAAS